MSLDILFLDVLHYIYLYFLNFVKYFKNELI